MSGSTISATEISTLFGSLSSGSGAGANLLAALYGGGVTGGTSWQNPIQALQTAEANQTQDIALTAQQPQVQRDLATFTAAVQSATSPQQLLDNPTVLKVLLTANALGDQVPYTALAQKALLSDPSDSNSLVNQLTDTNWKAAAQTYQFATQGLSVIQNSATLSTIANAYAEVTWRTSLDATTPGLSNALTFRSEASTITSVDQILGDPIMRTVVTTALNIPEDIAFQDLEAQEKAITNRLDITQFQSPTFVDSFTQKYLIAAQTGSSTSTPSMEDLAIQAQGLTV
jgi:hypothetical protein